MSVIDNNIFSVYTAQSDQPRDHGESFVSLMQFILWSY